MFYIVENTDLTYTSYIIAAILSFVGSLLLLGCFIASVHYAKYAYRYWCGCWHPPANTKKSGSVLSIASLFKTPHRISRLQPHLISRSRTSLQHQTVIIAHPTTPHHPMTVLYGQCIDSTKVDNPPPYSIVVPGRLSRNLRSMNSLDHDKQSIVGWDDFRQSLQNVQGFARERRHGWDSRSILGRGSMDGLGKRMQSLGSLNEERRFSVYAWDDHRKSTTSIDREMRPPSKNPAHDSFVSLCEVHHSASRRQSTAPPFMGSEPIPGTSRRPSTYTLDEEL